MTDIVEMLRQGSLTRDDYRWKAADEITRLRAENERLRKELDEAQREITQLYEDAAGESI